MKILIICFDNIGDTVFCSLLPREIKKQYPQASIDFLCKPYSKPVVEFMDGINDIFCIKPYWAKKKSDKGRWIEFLRLFISLRKNDYDIVINTSKAWRPSLFSRLIGIKRVIGFDFDKNSTFLTDSVKKYSYNTPVMNSISSLLTPLDINVIEKHYSLSTNSERKIKESFIILHPFAGDPSRCAPLELWKEAAEQFRGKYKVLWFGTPTELDKIRGLGEDDYFSDELSGGDFTNSVKLMVGSSLFVGHDSGPMHIAASLRIPTLGLFLPGEPYRTFPQGDGKSKVISKAEPYELTSYEMVNTIKGMLQDS